MSNLRAVVAERKRRNPGAISVYAIVLLIACSGNPFRSSGRQNLRLSMATALISRPAMITARSSRQRWQPSNQFPVLPGTALSAASGLVNETKSVNGPRRKRPTQKSGNGKAAKSRIIQRTVATGKGKSAPVAKTTEHWGADYDTSVKTQRKIQAAAANLRQQGVADRDPVRAAHVVLKTLLGTPPEKCNAANLVCALTISSKMLGWRPRGGSRGQNNGRKQPGDSVESVAFRKSLLRTFSVLKLLVSKCKLTPRQLCNAAWSVAKHLEHDPSLFGQKRDNFVLVSEGEDESYYSTWDLREQRAVLDGKDADGYNGVIDEVLNPIASRMVEHLEEVRRGDGGHIGKPVQPGELSMLLWAYAVAKPRDCPPGWERPRRMERLATEREKGKLRDDVEDHDADFITFVELDDVESSKSMKGSSPELYEMEPMPRDVADELFDAAAIAFCRGEGLAVRPERPGEAPRTTLLGNCTWSELSNVAWSYATRGAYSTPEGEAMMTFFAREATRRMRRCGGDQCDILPRDAIQIAWALGTMESDNVSSGDALVSLSNAINIYWIEGQPANRVAGKGPLERWKCADLVQMATALAHGRIDDQSVLEAIFQESLERLQHGNKRSHFSTREISTLMWVQARLYLTPKFGDVYREFPRVASRVLLRRMEGRKDGAADGLFPAALMRQRGLGPQEQANLAWSLTILEDYNSPDVVTLLQNIFLAASSNYASNFDANQGSGVIQLEHAHQLWQSYFLLSKDCPESVKHVPSEFSEYLEEKWNIEKSRRKRSSSRHRAISQTLDLMRVAHRNEYEEDVDVAIALNEDSAWTHLAQDDFENGELEGGRDRLKRVAVEFDGPHHFTAAVSTSQIGPASNGMDEKPRVLGHTVLKYRLLKRKGWTVVRIPYYEFDKIPVWASMERQRYLQRALKTHDKIEFSGIDVSEYKAMPETRLSRFD